MKTRIFRILKWSFLVLTVLLVVFIIMQRLEAFDNALLNMSFRYDDKKVNKIFSVQPVKPEVKYIHYQNSQIRFLQLISNPDHPYVVFIHGAPGSSADYHNFFKDEKLISKVNIISVDRPGYGYSDYGSFVTSLKRQAEAIQAVIDAVCKNNKILIVGHSYGGPIVLQMAIDNPNSYTAILLLAPAIDPKSEKEVKIASLGIHPLTRWLLTPAWRVASAEKLSHVSELEQLEPQLSKISIPVFLMHGTKDSLVPYENVEFAKEKIDPKLLEIMTLEGVDHFLPWTHHDLIVNKILDIINANESNNDLMKVDAY